jgi:hypothetical protein
VQHFLRAVRRNAEDRPARRRIRAAKIRDAVERATYVDKARLGAIPIGCSAKAIDNFVERKLLDAAA